jgi:hypothetical protein
MGISRLHWEGFQFYFGIIDIQQAGANKQRFIKND